MILKLVAFVSALASGQSFFQANNEPLLTCSNTSIDWSQWSSLDEISKWPPTMSEPVKLFESAAEISDAESEPLPKISFSGRMARKHLRELQKQGLSNEMIVEITECIADIEAEVSIINGLILSLESDFDAYDGIILEHLERIREMSCDIYALLNKNHKDTATKIKNYAMNSISNIESVLEDIDRPSC